MKRLISTKDRLKDADKVLYLQKTDSLELASLPVHCHSRLFVIDVCVVVICGIPQEIFVDAIIR